MVEAAPEFIKKDEWSPQSPDCNPMNYVGLFKGESLPRSARQIDRAGINEQDNNNMKGDIDRRNTQKHFCAEKTASFSRQGGWKSY